MLLFNENQLKEKMSNLGLNALLLADDKCIFYFTDLPITVNAINPVLFTLQKILPCILFITNNNKRTLLCPETLAQYLEENLQSIQPLFYKSTIFIDYWGENANKPEIYADTFWDGLLKFIKENNLTLAKIGIDSSINSYWANNLSREFPRLRICDAKKYLSEMRMIKTSEEIRRIKIATNVASSSLKIVQSEIESNKRQKEIELFIKLRTEIVNKGCQWNFTTLASGSYSSDIYHVPIDYELKKGDVVRLDIGPVYQGYGTDVARTFFVSPGVPEELEKLYAVLAKAQEKVIKNISPGVHANELFYIGQEYVRSHGYPQYTRTMIGHGTGIETEEEPFISPNSDVVLQPGMVLSIEFPYYIKGVAGLNVEDVVLVTTNGHQVIGPYLDK